MRLFYRNDAWDVLEDSLEQTGIEDNKTVVVDFDLAREIAVQGFEAVATHRFEAGVALGVRSDGERWDVDVGDGDLRRLPGIEVRGAGSAACS